MSRNRLPRELSKSIPSDVRNRSLEEEEIKILLEILDELKLMSRSGSTSSSSSGLMSSVTGALGNLLPEGLSEMLPSILEGGLELLPSLLTLL